MTSCVKVRIKTTSTDGSIFAGTKTKIANSTINPNEKYASIAQIDSSGNVETQVELKMNINYDKSASIIQTTDGDYVFTGNYIYAYAHQLSLSNVSWIMKITQQPTQASVTSQPGSPFILSSLELPIGLVAVIIIAAAIAVLAWKRTGKPKQKRL